MLSSQQLGDIALAEHRAVMAALIKSNISRPTPDQYETQLSAVREEMSCVISICPSSPSSSAVL